MPFDYYHRLSSARKRTYRKSDAIETLAIPDGLDASSLIRQLQQALLDDKRIEVQKISSQLITLLATGYQVPPLEVKVLATRPKNHTGELQGLYQPEEDKPSLISIWMRTAELKKVVAFKTFLRTLIHELCHHLDYEMYQLEETFHTEGFYKRESTLVNVLLLQANFPAKAVANSGKTEN
ncbi:MAG: hypothetical protein WCD07_06360 [Burkholderiales bacterium]